MLHWVNGAWVVEAQLHATRLNGFWDFPENNLAADLVDGASAEAPVFDGAEGGGGGFGLMIAVRQDGQWRWARFIGCPAAHGCAPLASTTNAAANATVIKTRHVVGFLGNCDPDCAASSVIYTNEYTWQPSRHVFALSRQVARGRSK